MEILGGRRDLITRMSYFYWILNYYDYAYESVRILRSLCKNTRQQWIDEQKAIVNMFQKQTMHINDEPIDHNTLKMLKRGDRYRLYILDIGLDSTDRKRPYVFYKMIEQMPDLKISKISVKNSTNRFLKTLMEKCKFDSKQDLLNVLDVRTLAYQSEPHEYISKLIC